VGICSVMPGSRSELSSTADAGWLGSSISPSNTSDQLQRCFFIGSANKNSDLGRSGEGRRIVEAFHVDAGHSSFWIV
jgi:hypothetical protein